MVAKATNYAFTNTGLYFQVENKQQEQTKPFLSMQLSLIMKSSVDGLDGSLEITAD